MKLIIDDRVAFALKVSQLQSQRSKVKVIEYQMLFCGGGLHFDSVTPI